MSFRMRGFDQGLGRIVYWNADAIDPTGVHYVGLGPVVDVVVAKALPGGESSSLLSSWYGNGADGAIHVVNGQTYKADHDIHATTILVDVGGTFLPMGFPVCAQISIENNGEILEDGTSGDLVQNPIIIGGPPAPLGRYLNEVAGGIGGAGLQPGTPGGRGYNFFRAGIFANASGGAGGAGTATAAAAAVTQHAMDTQKGDIDTLFAAWSYLAMPAALPFSGIFGGWGCGGGGGGGGEDGTATGGFGGTPGGVIGLFAPVIFGSGHVRARGGAGGTGTTFALGNRGGGGGGATGGLIMLGSDSGASLLATDVSGGAAGAGNANGTGGGSGFVRQYKVA